MKPRALSILVIGLALAGCSSPPARPVDRGPTLDRDGAPRSLVLANPAIVGDAYAWYDARNDYPRTATVEQDDLVYDIAVERTYDHSYSHNGRVDDHYHQRSYKQRARSYAP